MEFSKTLETINNMELEDEQRLALLESVKEDVNFEETRNLENIPSIEDLAQEINIRKN
ncbi:MULTISPECIES: hypothetical protein [Mammaliicoccus]|uniref:Mobile-element associated protein, putative n=1 Tax=Mammaliicoccus stepanovicii TaxID=643214 RepID=A0A239ZXL8_9STAP|nr:MULTISPECIES: hypothetical protein [Mammaliicoccus]GGI39137.1 hypothetical protein GCM10010896_01880 [Mammaliicoccus stepanovicii]SNV75456.1 mobile-element associated protein, putative [Mammaliicoccus stepanovicii]